MTRPTVVLIEKPESPHASVLQAALDQEYGPSGWQHFSLQQDYWQKDVPLVVLWDLHGHLPVEVHTVAGILAGEEVGVVVACGQVDEVVRSTLRVTGALALVADPRHPIEVAAALEVASATHRRLLELTIERQDLEQELADRLLIEKAKRVLIESRGGGEAEAMRLMQKQSRNTNQKLVDVARKVLNAYKVFNGDGE